MKDMTHSWALNTKEGKAEPRLWLPQHLFGYCEQKKRISFDGILRFAHIRGIPFIFNKIWSPNEILAGIDDVCHLLESISSSCRFWYKGFFPRSSTKIYCITYHKKIQDGCLHVRHLHIGILTPKRHCFKRTSRWISTTDVLC